ncbi:MAG: FecR domain-containing protein [Bdellovibrionaceae bacterium]|nr:FecR domain-containing protein [Pseudobdellovibrionaceae bacterium]
MGRNVKRLLIAFTVSCACYAATVYWYQRNTYSLSSNSDSKPIARLQYLVNDVQRKPIARVIWENISKNETLFIGETIRTASNSEATISFLGTNTLVELEPDTMIALEEGQGTFALNFLKGNMFLRKKENLEQLDSAGQQLVVKVGNNKVNINNAEMSLSKKAKGAVDLQVYSGQAQIDSQGQSITLDKSSVGKIKENSVEKNKVLIEVLNPQANNNLYSEPGVKKNIEFSWKPITEEYNMQLRWGNNRKTFNKQVSELVPAKNGKITQGVIPGKLYWQLVAVPLDKSKETIKSAIYKNNIIPKKGPLLLSPRSKEQLTFKNPNEVISFEWTHRMELKQFKIEISENPNFQKPILSQNLNVSETQFLFNIPKDGKYFWRVIGRLNNDNQEVISSQINEFTVYYKQNLPAPELISPENGMQITEDKFKNSGLLLSWNPVKGAESYKILIWKKTIQGDTPDVQTFNVANSPFRIKDLEPGLFAWSTVAIDKDGQESNPGKQLSFSIINLPEISWVNGSEPSEYFYFTGKPSLLLKWEKDAKISVELWRYRLKTSSEESFGNWKTTKHSGFNEYIPSDGVYIVELEALDKANKVVAKAKRKTVDVKQKPLLPGPQFAKEIPDVLLSNKRGQLDVRWENIQGAQKYKIQVMDQRGRIYKSQETDRNIASLSNLKPGNYTLTIKAVDEYKRTGESSEIKKIMVPKKSSIRAPKLKKVKVK